MEELNNYVEYNECPILCNLKKSKTPLISKVPIVVDGQSGYAYKFNVRTKKMRESGFRDDPKQRPGEVRVVLITVHPSQLAQICTSFPLICLAKRSSAGEREVRNRPLPTGHR